MDVCNSFCDTNNCDEHQYDVPICDKFICTENKCPSSAPFICYNDSPHGENWGCYSSVLEAKQGCIADYVSQKLCDSRTCSGSRPAPAGSYVCNPTNKICEHNIYPPESSQNRFETKEDCESISKLCRKNPEPEPHTHKFCPSNCIIPVNSCFQFTVDNPYYQMGNCACGYEDNGWQEPSMCELKNVGGTIYCGRSEEPRPMNVEDCEYNDKCNNRGRWISNSQGGGSCMGCNANSTGTFCDRCLQGTSCSVPQIGGFCPYPGRCI